MAFIWQSPERKRPPTEEIQRVAIPEDILVHVKASIFRIRTLADQGLRLELDIPESNLSEVSQLLGMRGCVLDVLFKPEGSSL